MKIIAKGYLKEFLKTQMSGLTGNIEQCGYPFDREWSSQGEPCVRV